jgi:adenine-specific DNA-methyltransferase
MAIQKIQPSYKFNEEQLRQLRHIAPEAFKDNILDFNALYEALADSISDDEFEIEHYGLNWPGKKEAKKMCFLPPQGSIAHVENLGELSNSRNNIFIEGENLRVLKLLQKSYANRIKLIYIDPPYNTGSDLIYEDDFSETIESYLNKINGIDERGKLLTTNTKNDGRFHSNWLSMMYPRLRISRDLLSDEGVIMVSVDNNEVANMKLLLNEIFGEENFVDCLIWQKRKGGGNDSSFIATDHEYIFIYTKVKDEHSKWRVPYEEEYLKRYREKDEIGRYYWDTLTRNGLQNPIIYDVKCPDGTIIKRGKWQISEETFFKKNKSGDIRFSKNSENSWTVHYKVRQPEGKVFRSIINNVVNGDAAKEIEFLFGNKKVFDNPKPLELLKQIFYLNLKSDDIILDFFAGSSSSGHAIMDINKTNNLNLKFIQVQIKETINSKSDAGKNAISLGYDDIFTLSKDRISFAIKKHKYSEGVMVFSLTDSNFNNWRNYTGTNTKHLETLFSQFESSLIDNWKPENLLTEILLIEGFPIDSKIESVTTFKKNKIQKVSSDFCEHSLFVCLDMKIQHETIKSLSLGENDIFICLDNAVTDQDKARLDDKGLIKTI